VALDPNNSLLRSYPGYLTKGGASAPGI
jgi:hypothetical protein